MARFVRREGLDHASLLEAIARAERGLVDADLGKGLIKQRVARAGKGRSGGYRTILAYRRGTRSIFLYGFAKSERANIGPDELQTAREIGGTCSQPSRERSHSAFKRANWRRFNMTAKQPSRLAQALLETADGMQSIGVMESSAHRRITVRHLGDRATRLSAPISPEQIRALRERANLSQAALASVLNLTVGYLSQLERGVKQPKGPSLALLNLIRHKGIEAVL
jgi:putative transcriptional regulator